MNNIFIVQSLEDLSHWTKDQAQAYLDKYHIVYDKNAQDQSLLDTVKRYHDAALANTNVFINNKTDIVNQISDATQLKQTYKLSTENANALANDIQHGLKQLELSGSLTREKVKRSLDRLEHKLVQQGILTESQFKQVALDIQNKFTNPTWYQRLWGSNLFQDDAYHTWLQSTITRRLEKMKGLEEEEIKSVVERLKQAVSTTASSSHLSKLGDANWWKSLAKDLEKNTRLTKDQIKAVVDSLGDEVTAYKIFAMDYASETAQDTEHIVWRAGRYLVNSAYGLYQAIADPLWSQPDLVSHKASFVKNEAVSSANSAKDAATEAVKDADQSASVLRTQATQGVNDAQKSFGYFWRQKELETYRALGYKDAHVEWIQNYLSKTFNDKKNHTKDSISHAILTIRQYLVQAKVQTTNHIDAQLKSVEELVHYWTRQAHDEL